MLTWLFAILGKWHKFQSKTLCSTGKIWKPTMSTMQYQCFFFLKTGNRSNLSTKKWPQLVVLVHLMLTLLRPVHKIWAQLVIRRLRLTKSQSPHLTLDWLGLYLLSSTTDKVRSTIFLLRYITESTWEKTTKLHTHIFHRRKWKKS
jgi:hypothetical protein